MVKEQRILNAAGVRSDLFGEVQNTAKLNRERVEAIRRHDPKSPSYGGTIPTVTNRGVRIPSLRVAAEKSYHGTPDPDA